MRNLLILTTLILATTNSLSAGVLYIEDATCECRLNEAICGITDFGNDECPFITNYSNQIDDLMASESSTPYSQSGLLGFRPRFQSRGGQRIVFPTDEIRLIFTCVSIFRPV